MSAVALKMTSSPVFSCEQIKQFFWFISFNHTLGYVLQNRSFQKCRKTYRKMTLPEFLSDKVAHHQACNFIKTSAQMFYCEFCEIVLNTSFQNSSGECFSFQFNPLNPQPAKDLYLYFPSITWFQIFLSRFLFLVEARNKPI